MLGLQLYSLPEQLSPASASRGKVNPWAPVRLLLCVPPPTPTPPALAGTSWDTRWPGQLTFPDLPSPAAEGARTLMTGGFDGWDNWEASPHGYLFLICLGHGGEGLFALHGCSGVHIATGQLAWPVFLPYGLLRHHPHIECPYLKASVATLKFPSNYQYFYQGEKCPLIGRC